MKEFYLLTSVFVGLIIIYDGYMLYKARGQVVKNKYIVVTSTIEFLWAIFTIYVLYTINFSAIQILIPVLFLTHNIIGWTYSVFLPKPQEITKAEDLVDIQIPRWYTVFCLSFGIVFALASAIVYLMHS